MDKTYKILFVEDNVDFRTSIAHQLRHAGFDVIEAENETQGFEKLDQDTYDLALVNLVMEYGDSGFTFCYHLKKRFPKMPTILCSSINNEMNRAFTLETDAERSWIKADAFLNKPLRFEQLLSEIENRLGLKPTNSH